MGGALDVVLSQVRACTLCAENLPLGPRPVVSMHPEARILIIGQAPGTRVHKSGVPWDDPSGRRLRAWMGVDEHTFYDPRTIAIMPMGFCYPGRGASGDLPPRPECAPTWHERLLSHLPQIELTLLLSSYAIQYYLDVPKNQTVTATVEAWQESAPAVFPLPHPSPRNNRWLQRNPWFESEVIPALQAAVDRLVSRRP